MEAQQPKKIDETFDWKEHERRYPKQKDYHKEGKLIKPADGLMLEVGQCINDIPLDQRHRYMWLVPDDMKDHPMYKEKDYGARIIREDQERIQKEKDDKVKKEQEKDDAIQLLLKHVSALTDQVNELTKQMKK